MIWSIEYERVTDKNRNRIQTTFISKEKQTDLVIGRFEEMHKNRLSVIECKPKYPNRKTNGFTFTADDYDRKFGRPKQPINWPGISPATRRGQALPDVWRLVDVPETAWKEDPCGITCIINWSLPADVVRLDLIDIEDGRPIISFQGTTDNVRKHTMGWLAKYVPTFDLAHAAYIGAELERADTERIDFVQDDKTAKYNKPYPSTPTLAVADHIADETDAAERQKQTDSIAEDKMFASAKAEIARLQRKGN